MLQQSETHINFVLKNITSFIHTNFILLKYKNMEEQECIPVECVPSVPVTVSGAWGSRLGGDVYSGGVCPRGVCPGEGVSARGRVSAWMVYTPGSRGRQPLWTDKRLRKHYLSATSVVNDKYMYGYI